jgi:hypothetical protein
MPAQWPTYAGGDESRGPLLRRTKLHEKANQFIALSELKFGGWLPRWRLLISDLHVNRSDGFPRQVSRQLFFFRTVTDT